jgi:hypothetical protein
VLSISKSCCDCSAAEKIRGMGDSGGEAGVLEDVCCVISQWTACSMHHRVELEQSNNVSEHSILKNSKTFPTDRSRVSGQGFLCCL